MNREKCIVLVSNSGYSDEHRGLLRCWLDKGIALFCVVGKDCEVWEEAMDYLCVNLDVWSSPSFTDGLKKTVDRIAP